MLFQKEHLENLPELYSQDGKGDKAKVFLKVSLNQFYVWLITEYSEAEEMFFGYVNLNDLQCAELGYFSLYELESMANVYPLEIEEIDMTLEEAKDAHILSAYE